MAQWVRGLLTNVITIMWEISLDQSVIGISAEKCCNKLIWKCPLKADILLILLPNSVCSCNLQIVCGFSAVYPGPCNEGKSCYWKWLCDRKVRGYGPVIPHVPAYNATPPLKSYQPMDMSGQRYRVPVVGNPPVCYLQHGPLDISTTMHAVSILLLYFYIRAD